jgi:hypothetical protein
MMSQASNGLLCLIERAGRTFCRLDKLAAFPTQHP